MKGISVNEPYGGMILNGEKTIETRTSNNPAPNNGAYKVD